MNKTGNEPKVLSDINTRLLLVLRPRYVAAVNRFRVKWSVGYATESEGLGESPTRQRSNVCQCLRIRRYPFLLVLMKRLSFVLKNYNWFTWTSTRCRITIAHSSNNSFASHVILQARTIPQSVEHITNFQRHSIEAPRYKQTRIVI